MGITVVAVVIYGVNPVREALAANRRPVNRIWAIRPDEWPNAERADAGQIAARCGSEDHQGVCAEAGPYPYADAHALLEPEDALVVALDQVQDPRNLGAVARVAECAGASGLVVPERRSAEVTPAACKTAAGAVEHLPVAQVRNLADFLDDAKKAGAWVYGASADSPTAYDEPDYKGRVVLVLGSEGKGLRPRVAEHCDQLISLPILGRVESLNVSTAAAAIVYGILQSRRKG
ncbi:MAG TPA: 23S rRNA (guanosine(2251)-2'-O)-methyltransferase RlmB [Thermoleophilaceae bacterium]|jgi:23S rRNA (guanosine2251-2'-O)-methyltransferase|nr:23S rRNA (guanosine(2251)-2'-O)-methyltransferase RlmB [Thermoleophilaceae bacterium]